jgi:hypothetical protein
METNAKMFDARVQDGNEIFKQSLLAVKLSQIIDILSFMLSNISLLKLYKLRNEMWNY